MTIEEIVQGALKKIEPILTAFYLEGVQRGWEIGMHDGKIENNSTCVDCSTTGSSDRPA